MAAVSIVVQVNPSFEEDVGAFFQKLIDYLKYIPCKSCGRVFPNFPGSN